MKKIFYKKMIIGAVVFLICTMSFTPFTDSKILKKNLEKNNSNENKQGFYYIAVGSPFRDKDGKIENLKVLKKISKEEGEKLQNDFLNINNDNSLSTENKIENKLGILRNYEILPKEFTYYNLTKYNNQGSSKYKATVADESVATVGLHLFLFAAVFGRANFINVPMMMPPIFRNITRLSDLFDIPDELGFLLSNVTIFDYGVFMYAQILMGGPSAVYYHIPILATGRSFIRTWVSFIAAYIPQIVVGVYIYSAANNTEQPGPEIPVLDIMIGLSLFSMWQTVTPLSERIKI